jgi:hypothetical protein
MAQSEATREALWLRKVAVDFGLAPGAIQIYTDSQSALKPLRNPIISQRSKHIDVRHHFTRERIANGEVTFTYLPTDQMAADTLTKSLPEQALCKHRSTMGVRGAATARGGAAARPA